MSLTIGGRQSFDHSRRNNSQISPISPEESNRAAFAW
jgi:hypothetical protein